MVRAETKAEGRTLRVGVVVWDVGQALSQASRWGTANVLACSLCEGFGPMLRSGCFQSSSTLASTMFVEFLVQDQRGTRRGDAVVTLVTRRVGPTRDNIPSLLRADASSAAMRYARR
jgi:hypothetical protein